LTLAFLTTTKKQTKTLQKYLNAMGIDFDNYDSTLFLDRDGVIHSTFASCLIY
jgi:histidinol phosphatase-like enzyme